MALSIRLAVLLLTSACALGPIALSRPESVRMAIDRIVPESATTSRLHMRVTNLSDKTIRGCLYPERTYIRVGVGSGTQIGPPVHKVCAYGDEFRIRPGQSVSWEDSVSSQLVSSPGEIDVTIALVPNSLWRPGDASAKVYLKSRIVVPGGGV
jgi:hypothetical protein